MPLCSLTPLLSWGHGKHRVFSGEVSGEQLSPVILSTSLSFPDYILYQQFVVWEESKLSEQLPGCAQCARCPVRGTRALTSALTQNNERVPSPPSSSRAQQQSMHKQWKQSVLTGWTGLSRDPRFPHSGVLHNGNLLFKGGKNKTSIG